MNRLQAIARSSIGAKTVMSLTGLALVGFVLGHMAGNLQIFAGQDTYNEYAHKLQALGPVLWLVRLGLLGIFGVHVASAIRLTQANRAARPEPYAYKPQPQRSTFMSRHMLMTGVIVLLFVAYHLAQFTLGLVHAPGHSQLDAVGRHDIYSVVVRAFQDPIVVLLYVAANALLALHIAHGAASAFQSLGVRHPSLAFLKKGFGPAIGLLIAVGNLAMPLAAFVGALKPAGAL